MTKNKLPVHADVKPVVRKKMKESPYISKDSAGTLTQYYGYTLEEVRVRAEEKGEKLFELVPVPPEEQWIIQHPSVRHIEVDKHTNGEPYYGHGKPEVFSTKKEATDFIVFWGIKYGTVVPYKGKNKS